MIIQNALIECLFNQQRLEITYHGEKRVIEVHAVGKTTKGNSCARVFQVRGGSVFGPNTAWKMLKITEIESFQALPEFFKKPRPGYSAGDKGMSEIYAEL